MSTANKIMFKYWCLLSCIELPADSKDFWVAYNAGVNNNFELQDVPIRDCERIENPNKYSCRSRNKKEGCLNDIRHL